MSEKKRNAGEEKLKHRVSEAIDEITEVTKQALEKVFAGMVERTSEVCSDIINKKRDKIKSKIEGINNGEE